MYAFGDDPNPLPESVNVLEEILVDYVSELVSETSYLTHYHYQVLTLGHCSVRAQLLILQTRRKYDWTI